MSFRLKITVWFLLTVIALAAILLVAAHIHLDEELRADRWDRSHPQFPEWVIHGSYTDAEVHDILGELMQVWAMVGIPLVLASGGVGYWIAMLSIRPIRQINRQMRELDWEGARQGISVPASDPEVAELVSALNSLLARLSRSFLEMSEFSSKVAHELRTPLTLLRMRVEKDAKNLPPEFSEDIQEEIRRLGQLVERALLAAKAEGGRIRTKAVTVDLVGLIEDLRDYYSPAAEANGMRFEWLVPRSANVIGDPEFLRQIFHNLLGNAVRHGTAHARLRVRTVHDGGSLAVFVTNRRPPGGSSGSGTGLGLRLVGGIAAALPQTTFRHRKTRTCFGVCLFLPSNAAPSDPSP